MLRSSRVISSCEVACLQLKIQLEAPGKDLIKRFWKQIDWGTGPYNPSDSGSPEPPEGEKLQASAIG